MKLKALARFAGAHGNAFHRVEALAEVHGRMTVIDMKVETDMYSLPRLFVHWPSELAGAHLRSGAAVMGALIDAQLTALASYTDYPVEGENAIAELR